MVLRFKRLVPVMRLSSVAMIARLSLQRWILRIVRMRSGMVPWPRIALGECSHSCMTAACTILQLDIDHRRQLAGTTIFDVTRFAVGHGCDVCDGGIKSHIDSMHFDAAGAAEE